MQLIQAECIEVNALLKSGRKGEDYVTTRICATCVHKLPTSKGRREGQGWRGDEDVTWVVIFLGGSLISRCIVFSADNFSTQQCIQFQPTMNMGRDDSLQKTRLQNAHCTPQMKKSFWTCCREKNHVQKIS